MKRVNLKCPYCGSRALLRPASVVYGERAADPSAPFYVCARYPACDSYVAAHRESCLPMGTLADKSLRNKHIQAHAALDRLWRDGLMTKRQAYLWLQAKLDLPEREVHIGKFSDFRCEQVVQLCDSLFPQTPKAAYPYTKYIGKQVIS